MSPSASLPKQFHRTDASLWYLIKKMLTIMFWLFWLYSGASGSGFPSSDECTKINIYNNLQTRQAANSDSAACV